MGLSRGSLRKKAFCSREDAKNAKQNIAFDIFARLAPW